MRKSLWIFAVCAVFICAGSVSADTPDGQTPAEETVCDNEQGAAYGLCTAYCEAMDCDSPSQRASDKGCEAVRRNFERKTGRPIPCAVACPCPGLLAVFAQIIDGTVGVRRCIADDNLLLVITDQGDTAIIDDGPPVNCNVNGEPPFIELSPAERTVCRVTIRAAIEATGVICRRSE
jgi:hypothetical protein